MAQGFSLLAGGCYVVVAQGRGDGGVFPARRGALGRPSQGLSLPVARTNPQEALICGAHQSAAGTEKYAIFIRLGLTANEHSNRRLLALAYTAGGRRYP